MTIQTRRSWLTRGKEFGGVMVKKNKVKGMATYELGLPIFIAGWKLPASQEGVQTLGSGMRDKVLSRRGLP